MVSCRIAVFRSKLSAGMRFLFQEGPPLVQGYTMTLHTCHCVGHLPPEYLVCLRDEKVNLAVGLSITVSFDFTLNLCFTFTLCSYF